MRLDHVDHVCLICDDLGMPTRRNHHGRAAELRLNSTHDTLDQPDIARDQPRLKHMHRVLANSARRPREFDRIKSRGVAKERISRDSKARRDRASQEFTIGRYDIEVESGAKVDDDRRPPM